MAISVTLPDGAQRVYPSPLTIADVAADIGPGLAKAALAGKVDGRLVDTSFRIEADAHLAIITDKWDPLESTCRHASLSIL